MKINVHAGHNPTNKVACGAVGLLDESTENRNVVKELKYYLEKEDHLRRIEWLLKGQNDVDCLRELGILCYEGEIAQLDYKKAFEVAAQEASEAARDDLYANTVSCLVRYYEDYDPTSYNRTYSLMESFELSERQANAILEMRLQRLTSMEVNKLQEELVELGLIIADLKDILEKGHYLPPPE